jgi:hypothetical protein
MSIHSKRIVPVTLAAALVVLLAGSIIVRARARSVGAAPEAPAARAPAPEPTGEHAAAPEAPAARVPAPAPVDLARFEIPCWSCQAALTWPVRSRVDLDLVAPLGDGTGNAALFFRDFARGSGRRRAELEAARAAMIPGPDEGAKVFPPDHPLLLEAEPWTEQATMRFYPELLPLAGWETEIPDLVFALELSRSWIARGRAAGGEAALEDFRRVVRLGRLLRQEDTTLVQDLVGLGCLRRGLDAIYDAQRERGDLAGALVAAAALGELAPQRLMSSERVTRADVSRWLSADRKRVEIPASQLDGLVATAEGDPDRRFRGEAILSLGVVAHLGTPEARERARRVLESAASGADERLAALAAWSLAHPVEGSQL